MAEQTRIIGDRFRLEHKLGVGGFGEVWRAVDQMGNDRKVALKLLHQHMLAEPEVRWRFAREARVLAKLDHPSIARAVAFEVEGDEPYLAMEYVDGTPLNKTIGRRLDGRQSFSLREIERILGELASAIDYAHLDQKVVHRDLKPRNIMLIQRVGSLFVKVLDFGIAKVLDNTQGEQTTAGKTVGSLLYMSAEQVSTLPVDHRSDVFSLGVILFELLTLRHPWLRKADRPAPSTALKGSTLENNTFSIMARIAQEARPKVTDLRTGLPEGLNGVLERALAIDPNQRFDHAQGLVDAYREAAFGTRSENATERVEMTPEVVQRLEEATGSSPSTPARPPMVSTVAYQGLRETPAKPTPTPVPVVMDAGSPFVTSASGGLADTTQATSSSGGRGLIAGLVALIVVLVALGAVLWSKFESQESAKEGVVVIAPEPREPVEAHKVIDLDSESPPRIDDPVRAPSEPPSHESPSASLPSTPEAPSTVSNDPDAGMEQTSLPDAQAQALAPPPPVKVRPPPPVKVRPPPPPRAPPPRRAASAGKRLSPRLRKAQDAADQDPTNFERLQALSKAIRHELKRIPMDAPNRARIERLVSVGVPTHSKLTQACKLLQVEIQRLK